MFRKLFAGFRSNASPPDALSFAVLDVETTGLFPTKHDRVVEIAIVRLDGDGDPIDEFVTLVNPERDIGPTRIHGIETRDVLDAPRFREVAGDIISLIAGTVLVAHHARFDSDFLRAEYTRLGHDLPQSPVICTLHLARRTSGLSSYKLNALCRHLDIPHDDAHSALGDARATAALFKSLQRGVWTNKKRNLTDLGCAQTWFPPTSSWPLIEPSGKRVHRNVGQSRREPSYLAGLASRLPPTHSTNSSAEVEYVDLLDRALEDRRVDADEAELLFETATRWGISGDEVRRIHHSYLAGLVGIAQEDGVVTDSERSDLWAVSRLLGHTTGHVDQLLAGGSTEQILRERPRSPLAGLSVCFTGESVCSRGGIPLSRSEVEELAASAGLSVLANVTKKLDILVLADPDSMSGKAQKARRYGTRLFAERVFWNEIGVVID